VISYVGHNVDRRRPDAEDMSRSIDMILEVDVETCVGTGYDFPHAAGTWSGQMTLKRGTVSWPRDDIFTQFASVSHLQSLSVPSTPEQSLFGCRRWFGVLPRAHRIMGRVGTASTSSTQHQASFAPPRLRASGFRIAATSSICRF
jgi:hypothetical protein